MAKFPAQTKASQLHTNVGEQFINKELKNKKELNIWMNKNESTSSSVVFWYDTVLLCTFL